MTDSEDSVMRRVGVAELAKRLAALPSSVGETVLVGIDGFSGAGKTKLAQGLGHHEDVTVLSIEEFYLGWEGLEAGVGRARRGLIESLSKNETPHWRSWDWENDREGPETERPVTTRVLLLEGCGAGALRQHQALTIWVHAEEQVRERRLRERADWAEYAPFRERWQRQEQALAAQEGFPRAADAIVEWRSDGSLDMRASPDRRGRRPPGWVPSPP